MMRAALSLLLLTFAAAPAHAQDGRSVRVALESLTVDGQTPPSQYRGLLVQAVRPTLLEALECYRARLAEVPALEGEMRVRLWVSARQVIRVTPETRLPDAGLEACALARVRAFRLPPEAPARGASVRFVVRFARGPRAAGRGRVAAEAEGPVVSANPPRLTRAVEAVTGPRRASELEAALVPATFTACAGVAGDLVLALDIANQGRIQARRIGGSVGSAGALRCVTEALRRVRLEGRNDASTARLALRFTP